LIETPPSTSIAEPVMKLDASEGEEKRRPGDLVRTSHPL
jgi:hypothetical protein